MLEKDDHLSIIITLFRNYIIKINISAAELLVPEDMFRSVVNVHGYGLFVPVIIRSFPNSRFINWVTRQVPQVEQELPTLPEHLSFTLTQWFLAEFAMLNRKFSV
jgi:hypothetical protein